MTLSNPEKMAALTLADLSKRLEKLEQDYQNLQQTLGSLHNANLTLEGKNQVLEKELAQLRATENERAIGTKNAFVDIERDMEEVEETFHRIYSALRIVDQRIPLGLDLQFKMRKSSVPDSRWKGRSRKQSLQEQVIFPSAHSSKERVVGSYLDERLQAVEEKLAMLSEGKELSDRSLVDAQKTLDDLHVKLENAHVLARKLVTGNGWKEKDLCHWRAVLADGNYGPLPVVKKQTKTVTIHQDAYSMSMAKDSSMIASGQAHESKCRRSVRRKSSSDLLFDVPRPGDTRPMSLFYCTIV